MIWKNFPHLLFYTFYREVTFFALLSYNKKKDSSRLFAVMMVLHLNKDYFGHDLSLSNICLVKTSLMTIIDNYFNKGSFFQNNRRK